MREGNEVSFLDMLELLWIVNHRAQGSTKAYIFCVNVSAVRPDYLFVSGEKATFDSFGWDNVTRADTLYVLVQ